MVKNDNIKKQITELIYNKNNDNAQGLGFVIIFIVFIIYGSIINGISFILSIISYCLICKLEYSKKKLYLAYTISIPCLELVEIGLFYLLSLFIKWFNYIIFVI